MSTGGVVHHSCAAWPADSAATSVAKAASAIRAITDAAARLIGRSGFVGCLAEGAGQVREINVAVASDRHH